MADSTPDAYGKNWRQHSGRSGSTSVRRATRGVEVVYYIRVADDEIKIGTSANMLERANRHGLPGKKAILAIEFGGRDLERQRHQQFAHLRIGRTERFRPGVDLLAHIDALHAENIRRESA